MSERRIALLLVAVALLASCWVFPLSFQLDDYMEIAKAPVTFGLEQRKVLVAGEHGPPLEGAALAPYDYAQHHPLWRPVVWLALLAGRLTQAQPLAPWIFRVLPLLAHCACVLLLWNLLRKVLPMRAAICGAVLFAVWPAGMQALSWISACGDVFMTLFQLLACHAAWKFAQRRSAAAALSWAACTLAAVLSKESALPGLALIALIFGFAPRPSGTLPGSAGILPGTAGILPALRPRITRCLEAALIHVPLLLLFWYRAEVTGSIGLTYQGTVDSSLSTLTAPLEHCALLLRLLVPWNRDALHADAAPFFGAVLPALVFASVAVLVLCAARYDWRRTLRLCVAGLGGIIMMGLPAVVLLSTHEHNSLGRAFYGIAIPLCATFAALLALLPNQRLLLALFAALLLPQLDLLLHGARTEHAASIERTTTLSAIEAPAATLQHPVVAVLGTPLKRAGIPFFTHLLPLAFQPPFRDQTLDVRHLKDAADLQLSELEWSAPGALLVVDASTPPLRLIARHEPLPAALPVLLTGQNRAEFFTFTPATAVAARAVRGLAFELPAGRDRWLVVQVRSSGALRELKLPLPESTLPRRVTLCLDDGPCNTGAFEEIALSAACLRKASTSGGLASVCLLAQAPELVCTPTSMPAVLSSGEAPRLVLAAAPHDARLRLELRFIISGMRIPLSYDFPAATTPRAADGSVALELGLARGPHGPYGDLGFANVRARIEEFTGSLVWTDIPCEWRIVAYTNNQQASVARTPWRHLRIVRGAE